MVGRCYPSRPPHESARIDSTPARCASYNRAMAGRDILHYRTIRLLGTGASGEAWLARDLRLGREVVLKFIGGAGEGDRRRWLEEEARSLAALSHPGIAAVYALEADG